ncbi:MAG: hypothetical protein LAT62_07350 [Natronospirillum sp.]|uniref:hypothetical protein n=1 Tax=Natronospirillum sp. TaxID=2812955 RepID=UPI0025D70F6D|nr:hypothetical protein [Natronospirillum sp.]MCH8551734.1 hypothetical protein [Natronospirillum sp.]
MTITDVEYAILLARSCDEARPDRERVYRRQAEKLNTDATSLYAYVCRYIEQLPVSLRTAEASAREGGLEPLIMPVTRAVENFFNSKCELSEEGGLLALLDRAYLGHRLLEELNDHLHVRLGRFILHIDMTEANMLAHQLIGEPYASELEGVVRQSLDMLTDGLEAPPGVVQLAESGGLCPFRPLQALRLRQPG